MYCDVIGVTVGITLGNDDGKDADIKDDIDKRVLHGSDD